LWPVIFFLPWISLGIAYLASVRRHAGSRAAALQRRLASRKNPEGTVRAVRISRDH